MDTACHVCMSCDTVVLEYIVYLVWNKTYFVHEVLKYKIIFTFNQDLARQLAAIKCNLYKAIIYNIINSLYASLQIPLVRHTGAFSTDWLEYVTIATYHFCRIFSSHFLWR